MNVRDLAAVASEYGPSWMAWRGAYEALLRSGGMRVLYPARTRRGTLVRALGAPPDALEATLAKAWGATERRFFVPRDVRTQASAVAFPRAVVEEADAVVAGRLRYWRWLERDVGNPPRWFVGDSSRPPWPAATHWSKVPDLSLQAGDIKIVWEPARFTQTFLLGRAYAVTGDAVYPDAFWVAVEDWIDQNPPGLGPHWRCAQEVSLRILAWVWGLHVFADHASSTERRVGRLLASIWEQACHVEDLHWYAARCVRNNHAISEAVALFTVGTALPFLPRASRWRRDGAALIAREVAWQIYEDGAYVQPSTNYSRVAAQLLTWSLRLAAAAHETLDPIVEDRAKRLMRFLLAAQDPVSGNAPNHGPNDGALFFPLATAHFLDHRPAIAALSQAIGQASPFEPGPWDEEATWFGMSSQPAVPVRLPSPKSEAFPVGGYTVLRSRDVHTFMRSGSFRHRPAQADVLHLDAWFKGHNVLIDPGTESYNLPAEWKDWYSGARGHNTITVDGRDPMRRGPKFMWVDWPKVKVHAFQHGPDAAYLESSHAGYKPVIHRRRVLLDQDLLCVVDWVAGDGREHKFRLHWLVNDFPLQTLTDGAIVRPPGGVSLRLRVIPPEGTSMDWVRADDRTPRGWQAPHYGERIPAWSGLWAAQAAEAQFVTLFGPTERVNDFQTRPVDEIVASCETAVQARLRHPLHEP